MSVLFNAGFFLDGLKQAASVLLIKRVARLNFVSIHPFIDGNGRMQGF
ncbi:MAG: Fic family protein [Endomicrobium sp.]|jgi:Fic family protein|nr:Fic family protein [Endomicrobium sp.]